MAIILNIETSTSVCSVTIGKEGKIISSIEASEQNSHASKLTSFIEEALRETGLKINELDAIAVSSGPGSYTGLRIGYSTAKGLCYAADKPLITVNTLQSLAYGARSLRNDDEKTLYCPMIDARRMEVYCALYNIQLEEKMPIQAKILDEQSFEDSFAVSQAIVFCGNGAFKVPGIIDSPFAIVENTACSAKNMVYFSYDSFKNAIFEDIAYSTPLYVKSPFITKPRKRL
ncbi:MAG: tRNA threonylcarbamoyladenosine biosynthesis protein TsaB [Maribacter sp.]